MSDQNGSADAGIARIVGPDDRLIGMGILLTDYHVLTCAHVVNLALERSPYEGSVPHEGATISVNFPFATELPEPAVVVAWDPPGREGEDIALLELTGGTAPPEASRAILVHQSDNDNHLGSGTILRMRRATDAGFYEEVQLRPSVGRWHQLSLKDEALPPGTSGSGVHDATLGGTVGIVVASSTAGPSSYMIPAHRIAKRIPELPIEPPRPTEGWVRLWQVLSLVALQLAVMLVIDMQSSETTGYLSFLTKGDEVLSAHFGLTLLGPLLTVVFVAQGRIARSFSQRRWYKRIPLPIGKGIGPDGARDAVLAGSVIFFLNLLPAYGLGVFAERILHDEVAIVVYTSDLSEAERDLCEEVAEGKCRHPDVGLWSTLPGHPYINNGYHILGTSGNAVNTVTYWPILAPFVQITTTATAFASFLWAMALTFRSPTRQRFKRKAESSDG
ncbi:MULTISPECIES: serine protease [unclassified Roseovarius]|uniref:S1 family peptidase n=1 Tax=unclassified Roseovarius TaxID=2614913 RepID=UPI00273FD6E6|nr:MULTISPECIES: serine protease [unclassified Roseovarius]